MKKSFSILMVLVMTLALASAAVAAVPAPGGPFNSEFTVQNLETTQAQCSYAFYRADGTTAFTSATTTINPGDKLSVYVPSIGTLPSGSYSAVVSCDRKVAAITNFDDGDSGAAHSGIAEPAATWYAPAVYDNYYSYFSNIVVQNASSSAVNITVEIFAPGSSTPFLTQTANNVPANASANFEQEGTTLANNVSYSAKISATGPIAPVVNIYGSGASAQQLYSYNPFKAGSLKAYAPAVYNNYYSYNTQLIVQNLGAATANVTVAYTNGFSTNHTIPSNSSVALYTPGQGAGLPAANVVYGATVTSDQNVVVLVNMSNPKSRAASYSGFASGTLEVRAPAVFKNYYTFDSSITCQNIGAANTTLTISYAGIASTRTTGTIVPGGTLEIYLPGDPLLSGVPINYSTAAKITSAQNIVCIVNSDRIPAYAALVQDQLKSYEGLGVTP